MARVLGENTPDTLAVRDNLAYWQAEARNAAGAAAAYEFLIPNLVRVLGTDHPDTLASWNDLGDPLGRLRTGDDPAARR